MRKADIFRPDALNLFLSEHPLNERFFPSTDAEDRIACFFGSPAFDLISRAAHTARKAEPGSSKELFGSAESFFSFDNVDAQALLRKFIDEESPLEAVDEDLLLLNMLGDVYRTTIRGAELKCWASLERTIEEGAAKCVEFEDCFGEKGGSEEGALQCDAFLANWRNTSLALGNGSLKSSSSRELRRSLFKAAPVLELVADPESLEDYIEREFCEGAGKDERRSPRGLAVRLLTLFMEYSLQELNESLRLTSEKRLRFLS